jgi:gliding motility-associated-like protein
MLRRHLYLLLFGIALFSTCPVTGQAAMPDNVCLGESRHYEVDSKPGSTYTWWIDGVVQPGFTSNEFVHTWNTSNTYLLQVQERSADGCMGPVTSGQVFVNPIPTLAASGSNISTNNSDGKINFIFTNVPDGIYTISFSTGIFPNVSVTGGLAMVTAPAGTYNNLSITIDGCTSTSSADIVLTSPIQLGLAIPEAFSPNRDLVNDVWNIGNIDAYPNAEITIYNRWGQPVWKSEQGYPHPWDGKSNGVNLPIDSYHYIIDLHNGSKPVVGEITIVR